MAISMAIAARGPIFSVILPVRIDPNPVDPKYIPTISPTLPLETSNSSLKTVAKKPGKKPNEAPMPTAPADTATSPLSELLTRAY
jgi:hypothetical protein